MKANKIASNAILSALYVVLTLVNPIGWGALQLRVSEMLMVIPFFNRKYIYGAIIGVIIANSFSPLGVIDVAVGTLCCIISYTLSKHINNKYINACIYSAVAGALVGLELKIVFRLPFIPSVISVFISTLIITFIGVFIFKKNDKLFTDYIKD